MFTFAVIRDTSRAKNRSSDVAGSGYLETLALFERYEGNFHDWRTTCT
jgi:hypothetical protein